MSELLRRQHMKQFKFNLDAVMQIRPRLCRCVEPVSSLGSFVSSMHV